MEFTSCYNYACISSSKLESERNFHIFYRLLAGMSSAELEKLRLKKDPNQYTYLTKVTILNQFGFNIYTLFWCK